jgi:hypothetical protein
LRRARPESSPATITVAAGASCICTPRDGRLVASCSSDAGRSRRPRGGAILHMRHGARVHTVLRSRDDHPVSRLWFTIHSLLREGSEAGSGDVMAGSVCSVQMQIIGPLMISGVRDQGVGGCAVRDPRPHKARDGFSRRSCRSAAAARARMAGLPGQRSPRRLMT